MEATADLAASCSTVDGDPVPLWEAAPELFLPWGLLPPRYAPGLSLGGNLFERAAPFVTYMLLHAEWTHVAVNSIWLLPFGGLLARRYGTPLFLLFFLLCRII